MTPEQREERKQLMCMLRRDGNTLESIAKEFGITRERVRQITAPAMGRHYHCNVDPIKVLQSARKSNGMLNTARELGIGAGAVRRCLKEMGVLPAVMRLHRMRRRYWSKARVLEAIKVASVELGRTPTTKDMNARLAGLPPSGTVQARCGSITSAQKLAGLPPAPRGFHSHKANCKKQAKPTSNA